MVIVFSEKAGNLDDGSRRFNDKRLDLVTITTLPLNGTSSFRIVLPGRSRCFVWRDIYLISCFLFTQLFLRTFVCSISVHFQGCLLLKRSSLPTFAMAGSTKCTFQARKAIAIHSRNLSSQSLRRQSSLAADHASSEKFSISEAPVLSRPPSTMPKAAPLSILPLSTIIRSFAITSISSSPVSTMSIDC
jgi:hypothetical protein